MKQYLVMVVSLTLIAHAQSGLVDGLFGTVKDTTSSITQSIGGALHNGKSFVFGSSETNPTGQTVTKPGLVGRISLKIHDMSETVRDEVLSVYHMFDNKQNQGKGILGRLLERVKCRVFKIKSFLFNHSSAHNEIENIPTPVKLNDDTNRLRDNLKKYFFKSGSSGIRQTLFSIQNGINRLRINKNKQQSGDNGNTEHDGAGMLDIRSSANNLAGGLQDDFENGLDAAYDKIQDEVDEGRDKAQASVNTFKQDSNKFIENQKQNVNTNLNQLDNDANKFKINVDNSMNDLGKRIRDESDKVKDLMENSYSKADFNSEGKWGRGSL